MQNYRIFRYPEKARFCWVFWLLAWLAGGRFAFAQQPKTLAIMWPISTHDDRPGSIAWSIPEIGWKEAVRVHLLPWIKWAEDSGIEPTVILHCPFGQWEDMRLDALDAARAARLMRVVDLKEFREAWLPITENYHCIAYVGGVEQMPWVPWRDLEKVIERNLAPFVDSNFHRACIDASANSIQMKSVKIAGETFQRSRNLAVLSAVEEMFGSPALIEATPKNRPIDDKGHPSPAWAHLHGRDIIIREATWQENHVHIDDNDIAKGYGEPSYLKGTIYRDVSTLAEAREVLKSPGHVPAVRAWKFTLVKPPIKASEIFEGVQ